MLPATGAGLRTLQLQERARLSVAEQDHYPSRRLCIQWHLQFYHTAAGALQVENLIASHHSPAGATARHRISRRHLVLPARVLDARID